MRSEQPILTISIAADLLKLHPRTLMQYEKENLFVPYRTKTNRRRYSKRDLERLQFVKFLSQEKGIGLKGIRFILKAIEIANQKGINLQKYLFPDFKPTRLI